MYYDGLGVPQDNVRAHMWCSLAAASFWIGAKHELAVWCRNYVAKFMTPAQIAEAQRLAREWMEKHKR